MDKLVALRKEQSLSDKVRNVNYESLLAPFYYKAGDLLTIYIQMNTDELGTVRPFQEDVDGESASEPAQEQSGEAQAPEEEKKEEEDPSTGGQTMMINTSAPA